MKELLPIIAAYWGAECSYNHQYLAENYKIVNAKVGYKLLGRIEIGTVTDLKLHLRPLWSITEEELRELGGFVRNANPSELSVRLFTHQKVLDANFKYNDNRLQTFQLIRIDQGFPETMDNLWIVEGYYHHPQIINHLRKSGFCLDQSLIDAGLVEWKGVKQ